MPVDARIEVKLVPVAVSPRLEGTGTHAAAEEIEHGRVIGIALHRVGRDRGFIFDDTVVVVLVIDRAVDTQAIQQVVHRMFQLDGIVEQRVENTVRPSRQQAYDSVLRTELAARLHGQGILFGTRRAGKPVYQAAVDHTRRDEGVALVNILHDAFVTRRQVIGVASAAQSLRFTELPRRIDRDLPVLGHRDVEIRPEIIAVELRTRIGVMVVHVPRDAGLREIAERYEILYALCAARHVEVDLHLRGIAVEHLLIQVAVGIVKCGLLLELLPFFGRKVCLGIDLYGRIIAVVLELPEIVIVENVG